MIEGVAYKWEVVRELNRGRFIPSKVGRIKCSTKRELKSFTLLAETPRLFPRFFNA